MKLERLSSRGSALHIILGVLASVLLLVVLALVALDVSLRRQYEPGLATMRRSVTDNVDFYCEQQTVLARDPWFHEPRPEADAGLLLNAWVPWDPSRRVPPGSPLTIPAPLPQNSGELKDWLTSSIDVSGLDFGWMGKLHAYDRWDILKNTPHPPPARLDWANAPVPNFISLQLWAKFRLLHGLRTGQPLEAARDVRQLAWLAYRTDTLIGGAIANALLRVERAAYDSMKAPPPEWRPMSQEQLERMRAIVMTGHVFSSLVAPVEVGRKARRCGDPVVSRCIALGEASFMAKYLQPYAGVSYRPAYAALAEDIAAFPCATSLVQTVWERGATLEHPSTGLIKPAETAALQLLPRAFSGRHMVGILISIGPTGIEPLRKFRAELSEGKFKPAP